jgi:DNA-binding CsgD family transcriptional regulator
MARLVRADHVTDPPGGLAWEQARGGRYGVVSVDTRVGVWVDLVGDLLARPPATFPARLVSARLSESFDCQVSWNWMNPVRGSGYELHLPVPGWPPPALEAELMEALVHHPVMAWYRCTGRPGPMSSGRVPSALVTAKGRAVVQEYLVPYELEQQLVIPVRLDLPDHAAFVLARGREDFTAADMAVAWQIQPLLRLLDRQLDALGEGPSPDADTGALTAREQAVIRFLAEGLTADGIGRRLAISPRTVHRHLDSAYRKLGVNDRVCAVLAARDAGLLPPAGHDPS